MKVTGSGMQRAELCPASTFLPRVEELTSKAAERGRAIHAFLCACVVEGREKALESAPEDFRADCDAIDLSLLPHANPEQWAVEVGFAWNWETDTARELFRSADSRDYSGAQMNEVCGTADLLGVTSDSVVVLDVKTGYAPLAPPNRSLQLLFYAVAAARAYGKASAVVGWVKLRDGLPYFERAFVDILELDAAAARMRNVIDAALATELLFAADPSTLVPTVGVHCRYCPSFRVCPANVSLLGELVRAPDGKLELPVLDATTAPLVLERAEQASKVLELVFKTIEEFAENNPFDMPNGQRFGPVTSSEESVDPFVAKPVLDAIDPKLADEAIEVKHSLTKAALERSLKPRLPPGKKLTPFMREVMDDLRKAGAVKTTTWSSVKRHKPKPPPKPPATINGG